MEPTPTVSTPPTWLVKHGQQTARLKSHLRLPAEAADKLIAETSQIMGLCGNPADDASAETGLALGFVQSGKTMSFTSLIALARDNDYQLVIVVAGTTSVLVAQSIKRLTQDLQLAGANSREWRIIPNPTVSNGLDGIRATLNDYRNTKLPRAMQRTAIIVVMKNKKRLESLTQVMGQLAAELRGVPTLIVDDEADQAGMNTEARPNRRRVANGQAKKQSPVYAQLLKLKDSLPHHTFVQYTATPQAPLFIERQDDLSPNFIKLLTPGTGYTGGERFFASDITDKLVRPIPTGEVYGNDHQFSEPPASLLEAMRIFFLGVAERYATNSSEDNRSMMLHPSQLTGIHQVYYNWVINIKASWERLLNKPETDPDRLELEEDFRAAHSQLTNVAPFDEHLDMLQYAIQSTQVRLLNAAPGSAPQIDWVNHYSFILVGGQAMDRGFTVEGLTVTYMPRGLGTGTADTIQQRARFFGYKEKFLNLCRVYLTRDVRGAFADYVQHEIDLRNRLGPFDAGHPLNDFQRCVVLPSSLTQLTRPAVLSDDTERYHFGGGWITTRAVVGNDTEYQSNKSAIKQLTGNKAFTWQTDEGSAERTPEQIHSVAEVPLAAIVELLRSYSYLSTDDASAFAMLANSLETFSITNQGATGMVYRMSPSRERTRSAVNGKVRQLFQGRNPKKGAGKLTYPGDAEIKSEEHFSLQIHTLKVKVEGAADQHSFALGVWVPASAGVEMVRLASE
ncbi:hypothetical protein GCM10022409_09890 [Hymenobacter glaciei]|uniref:Putative endonuclease Z1 domain-containing protein n=1 Tax=Hymenobacter glaciei TaxID=877209 RepID=A0ABP7TLG4_9BACT